MSGIIPIPNTRVSDLFIRQRLTNQAQADQLGLFRLQTAISTGQRIQLPSEDAPAALRAISLQRLLDRKAQIKTNLQASNQYLAGADSRLASISTAVIELRGAVVGISGNLTNQSDRQAIIQQVDSLIQELVSAGNAKIGGRYLFAGSRSHLQPYDFNGEFVQYSGNEGVLRSFVDIERLFETNLAGTDVFGGISAAVKGNVDVNPQATSSTLVSSLNGGAGIGPNPAITVHVNNGVATVSKTVDLRTAVTLGDVARVIESNAPPGTSVTVDVTSTGLVLSSSGNGIGVTEAGDGRTARFLGLNTDLNAPLPATLVGGDLNPTLLKTTKLHELLGTKAQGTIAFTGTNNNIQLTANTNGTTFNNLNVVVQDGVTAGSETAVYDSNTNTLTVTIQDGISTAKQIAAAISAEGTFSAAIDYSDASSSVHAGNGYVAIGGSGPLNFPGVTAGGGGQVLDTTNGLHLTNAGRGMTLDISSAKTVEDLLNLINGSGMGLLAEINATGNGINVRSTVSGADFMIGENGGTTATQLGIRTYTGATELAGMNRGLGIPTSTNSANDDLTIIARSGQELSINLAGATTVQDIIDLINGDPDNPGTVQARLATTGNGIELVDSSVGTGTLTVRTVEGSRAAEYLGFVAANASQSEASDVATVGGNQVLKSQDRNTHETDSVFNTLVRLKTALQNNDETEITRTLDRLDQDLERLNFARAEIGGRLQNLEVIGVRLEDENVQLKAALSQDIDVDLIEAISQLTARQYAFEASLRASASIMQMSLLNFL